MSDADHQGTDILLPQARIAVFSQDEETLSSAAALDEDWRYARVDVLSTKGGVQNAIDLYEQETSPELLIIQTDEINDAFTDKLGELSQYCEEGTAAIIIGPVNDVYLYRQLIDMGVSDYLVRPVSAQVLSEVIAKALISRLGVSGSRLVAFIGAKGGVGTSTLAQIGAWVTAEKMAQKTFFLDAGGAASPASVGFGFDPSATLMEASRAVEGGSDDSFKRILHQVGDRLTALATGADAMLDPSLSGAQFEAIMDKIMAQYPVVLVDLSCASSGVKKAVIARAHQIVVATTPTVTSLRFCRTLMKEISDIRGGDGDEISLLVNKAGQSKANEVSENDIAEALEQKPDASLAYAPATFLKHESESKAFLSDKDSAALVDTFFSLLKKSVKSGATEESAESEKNSGVLGGFLSKLKSK